MKGKFITFHKNCKSSHLTLRKEMKTEARKKKFMDFQSGIDIEGFGDTSSYQKFWKLAHDILLIITISKLFKKIYLFKQNSSFSNKILSCKWNFKIKEKSKEWKNLFRIFYAINFSIAKDKVHDSCFNLSKKISDRYIK